jgi:CBS domain-containing membrane protein
MNPHPWQKWLGIELIAVNAGERLVATTGGGIAMLVLAFFSFAALPQCGAAAVVASMGASSVLLFANPHGPLSQPWPVLAGHGFSALIGVTCARWIDHPYLAMAAAVGFSIGAMHQLKCIHPPGGATAFTAVMGGEAIADFGYSFVIFPVLTNALAMVAMAVIFNYPFPWRRYPSILSRPMGRISSTAPVDGDEHERIIAALRSINSFVDVSEEDLREIVVALRKNRSGPPGPAEKNGAV